MFQHSVKSVNIDLVHHTNFSHDHFFWHNYCVKLSIPWQVELVNRISIRMMNLLWLHGSNMTSIQTWLLKFFHSFISWNLISVPVCFLDCVSDWVRPRPDVLAAGHGVTLCPAQTKSTRNSHSSEKCQVDLCADADYQIGQALDLGPI